MYCNASATDRVRWRSHLWQCGQAHFHKRLKFKMCIHLFGLCVCNPGPGEAQESTGFLFFFTWKPIQTQWSGWGELTSLFYWTVKYWVPMKNSTPCLPPTLQDQVTELYNRPSPNMQSNMDWYLLNIGVWLGSVSVPSPLILVTIKLFVINF